MALREGLPGTIYRADYQAPDLVLPRSALEVRIDQGRTEVTATLEVVRRISGQSPLKLDGEQLICNGLSSMACG